VLVVDDNQAHLDIIKHMLESVGMRVVCRLNGKDVAAALQDAVKEKDPFSLCIVDMLLADMNGVDVAKAVRSLDPEVSQVPLLAFSSSMALTARNCKEVGFDGFLPKPVRRDRLYKILEGLLSDTAALNDRPSDRSERKIITQHSIRERVKHSVQILLAEDNKLNQKLAVLMLKSGGYQIEVVNDGQEAIDKFTASPDRYDLIFMDIQMPNVDGLAATRAIRKAEADMESRKNSGYRTPIIAMTANAMKGDREICLDAGMDDYMAKPIKREKVFEMLDRWVLSKYPRRFQKK
jgi:CheY-like chemotaxis protein